MLAIEVGLRSRPLSDDERADLCARAEGVPPMFPQ